MPSADLKDGFAKLREQARACLQLPSHSAHGVELLARTDLKLLTPTQKSDVYLTKAELLLAGLAASSASGAPEHGGAQSEDVGTALASSIFAATVARVDLAIAPISRSSPPPPPSRSRVMGAAPSSP